MEHVNIPATIGEATSRLEGLDRLLTARGWERAAIVAAFVRLPGPGARSDLSTTGQVHSTHTFAALGIRGLASPVTVQRYVAAWLDTHDGIHPEPGTDVDLPDQPFPPEDRTERGGYQGTRTTVENIGRVLAADADLIVAAAKVLPGVLDKLPEEIRDRLGRAVDDDRRARFRGVLADVAPQTLDDEWIGWLTKANAMFINGARLAERSDRPGLVLGVHAAAALELYTSLTERRVDAELRQLLDAGR